MTPLSSISTSGPYMSVAMSVELGTSMAVDLDDRAREIHDTVATLEIDDTASAYRFRNPSHDQQIKFFTAFHQQLKCFSHECQMPIAHSVFK